MLLILIYAAAASETCIIINEITKNNIATSTTTYSTTNTSTTCSATTIPSIVYINNAHPTHKRKIITTNFITFTVDTIISATIQQFTFYLYCSCS